MLRIQGIKPYQQELFDLDEYSWAVEWSTNQKNRPIYWRTGDLKRSLIEVKLLHVIGDLVSVRLLIADQIMTWSPDSIPITESQIPVQRGIPAFDVSAWPSDWDSKSYIVDEAGPLNVRIGDDIVAIEFADRKSLSTVVQAERIAFGMNSEGFLTIIEANSLSTSEMSLIRMGLLLE